MGCKLSKVRDLDEKEFPEEYHKEREARIQWTIQNFQFNMLVVRQM